MSRVLDFNLAATAFLLALSCITPVSAAQIEKADARTSGDQYIVELVMTVEIPEDFAREILEDPDRVIKVNHELVSVQHLPSVTPGVKRFRDHAIACVWIFCFDYENTVDMRLLSNQDIQLTIDPAHSDFRFGVFTWRIKPLDEQRTRLVFHSISTPGFWVPSIGILRSRMTSGMRRMLRNMECEYHQETPCAEPVVGNMWQESILLDE